MGASSHHLTRLVAGTHQRMGLALAALALGKESDPRVDVVGCMDRIIGLANAICRRLPATPATGDILFALNTCLFDDLRFAHPAPGQSASAPFIHSLLEERCGDEVTFVIFYLTLGRLLHLPLEGISFSGRLLVRLTDGDGEDLIDPCAGGIVLTQAELKQLFERAVGGSVGQTRYRLFLERMDDRAILVRLLRRYKAFHLAHHHYQGALSAVEAILDIAPAEGSALLEHGRLLEAMSMHEAAAADYFHYLERHPGSPEGPQLRERLRWLLGKGVVLH